MCRMRRRYLPLSLPAKNVVADMGVHLPGNEWFREFYKKFPDIVEEKLAQREDRDRAAKNNEAVVQEHFFGSAGLKEELLDAKDENGVPVMDEEGRIDGWRLAWLDECPNA